MAPLTAGQKSPDGSDAGSSASRTITLLSVVREQRAQELLKPDAGNYCSLKEKGGAKLADDSTEFERTQQYQADVEACFSYRTNYFPHFHEKWRRFRPFGWTYFVDIHDETIEQRFPRDQDLRAFIAAFRLSLKKNQVINVRRKRTYQFCTSILVLAPCAWLAIDPGRWAQSSSNAHLGAGALYFVGVGIVYLALNALLKRTTREWKLVFTTNARDLSSKIQNRMNSLTQNYQTFLRELAEAHTKTGDIEGNDWLERTKWWTQIAVWTAFRVDFIEKFLQSEMQRVRIFAYWSDTIGNASAFAVWFFCCALAGTTIWAFEGLDPSRLTFWWFCAGTIVAAYFAWSTTLPKFSISPRAIEDSVGDHDWNRFSDLKLDEEMGDQIKKAKAQWRIDRLQGGYGSMSSRGGHTPTRQSD